VPNPDLSDALNTIDLLNSPSALPQDSEEQSIAGEASTSSVFSHDTAFDSLPPPKGFAVGGHVTASNTLGSQQIAPSDTVPAMLTPGEFVINATNTQKHLNLLKHINTGGTVEDYLVSSHPPTPEPDEQKDAASVETSTKVESSKGSSVQRKSSGISSPKVLGLQPPASARFETEKHALSTLSSLQSNYFENKTTELNEPSTHYSSTPLIFRKRNPEAHAPNQWSSIEDLLSGNDESSDAFTPLSSSSVGFHQPKGFAAGGEVTAPDISKAAQPITVNIKSPDSPPVDADSHDLEVLAREIYHRLRQRLELERERHGMYSGRLSW
jgi:hypothetical protein